jgi:hypothetical protein
MISSWLEFAPFNKIFKLTLCAKIIKLSGQISKRGKFAHAKHDADLMREIKLPDGLPHITKSLILTGPSEKCSDGACNVENNSQFSTVQAVVWIWTIVPEPDWIFE